MKKRILFIGAGGCGTNWASAFIKNVSKDATNNGDEYGALIVDGSDSNIRGVDDLKDVEKWICPDTDGAGSWRAQCAVKYIEYVKQKFSEMPEADIYIIGYSSFGGSGSVFGPELHRMLLESGKKVFGITNVSGATMNASSNSLNVINGLTAYAKAANKPAITTIINNDEKSVNETDIIVSATIDAIAHVTGTNLQGLDTADIGAFLDFTRHSIAPSLVELRIYANLEAINSESGKILTTLSAIETIDSPRPQIDQLDGFFAYGTNVETHLATMVGDIANIQKMLIGKVEHFEAKLSSHQAVKVEGADEMKF